MNADAHRPIQGLTDSKKISAKKREALAKQVKERALAWTITRAKWHYHKDAHVLLKMPH
jgi:ribonuclease HII